jgi:hypothetical protein
MDDWNDCARDQIPVRTQLDWNHGLDVERVTPPGTVAHAKIEIALQRKTDQRSDGIG